MRRAPALVLGVAVALAAGCGGGDDERPATPEVAADPPAVAPAPRSGPPPMVSVRRHAARIIRRTQLRSKPNGPVVQVLARKTKFNGRQQVAVVARRGTWLGVLHPSVGGGRAGWIPEDAARLVGVRYEIAIDRSARVGRVRRDGKVIRRFQVAVGRPGSETPVGRYAITDLLTPAPGSPYGCCILALTARQAKLPQGWGGGTRVAMHGSPTDQVGGFVSAGCIRLRRRDLRWMFKRTAAGTRVEIKA